MVFLESHLRINDSGRKTFYNNMHTNPIIIKSRVVTIKKIYINVKIYYFPTSGVGRKNRLISEKKK